MPAPTYATCKPLLQGQTLRHGETGFVATLRFRMEGLAADPDHINIGAFQATNDIDQVLAPGFHFENYSLSALDFAINLPPRPDVRAVVPKRGDSVPTVVGFYWNGAFMKCRIVNLYCLDLHAHFPTDSTDIVEVVCTLGEIGIPIDTDGNMDGTEGYTGYTFMWLVGAAINGTTVNTRTNFGWTTPTDDSQPVFGKLLQVFYKTGGPSNYQGSSATASPAGNTLMTSIPPLGLSQYVSLPTLETITNFQYRMREIIRTVANNDYLKTPQGKASYYNGSMNSTEIWGYPPFTLRLRMTVGEMDALRSLWILNPDFVTDSSSDDGATVPNGIVLPKSVLWETNYHIEHRLRGWKEFATLKDPRTGFEPQEIESPSVGLSETPVREEGNGWMRGAPLRPLDFHDLNLPDLRRL